MPRIVTLDSSDIERLVEFEAICFDPTIQANRESILDRLKLGHSIVGLEKGGLLVGAVAFSYAQFDPDDLQSFPSNEAQFGLQPVPSGFNAAFIYSRGIHPSFQGRGFSKLLVSAVMSRAKADGCIYAVGNPRTASYAGSSPISAHESIAQQPRFKAAIDRYLGGGPFPSREELLTDPSLLYFSHVPSCRFHWILPGFAPYDVASGGIRIIVYVPLADWQR